ncbi:arylamine N-acetyltransferase [Neisseriaceae bacterium TC5R-5]|nr:arylamine N-acetyltransferase [Neisseriaceae bacterium TC5R-5]
MKNIANEFFQRIKLDAVMSWNLAVINKIIAHSQQSLPFDNLSVLYSPEVPLTAASIREKIIINGKGGLCYELNPLLHSVMQQSGINITLMTATVYDNVQNNWFAFQDTHVFNILNHDGKQYLLDIGFGLKSPRVMVALNGDIVKFKDTEYQITHDSLFYYFNFKKSNDLAWSIGYRFTMDYKSISMASLEKIRKIITFESVSPFNKTPLIAIFTADGSRLLTNSSYTVIKASSKRKRQINQEMFKRLAKLIVPSDRMVV